MKLFLIFNLSQEGKFQLKGVYVSGDANEQLEMTFICVYLRYPTGVDCLIYKNVIALKIEEKYTSFMFSWNVTFITYTNNHTN